MRFILGTQKVCGRLQGACGRCAAGALEMRGMCVGGVWGVRRRFTEGAMPMI